MVRIVEGVPGSSVNNAVRIDRRSRASPHAASGRKENADPMAAKIIGIKGVWIPAATLRRRRVDNVAPEAKRVWFAVGRHEFRGRCDLGAVGKIQLMKHAV